MSTRELDRKAIEKIINETIGDRLTSIEKSLKDITAIKNVLLGDGQYSKVGMKEQHDQMWQAYFSYKEDQMPARVGEMWDSYQNKKLSKFDEKATKIIEVYNGLNLMLKILGITSVSSLIMATFTILKMFGKL